MPRRVVQTKTNVGQQKSGPTNKRHFVDQRRVTAQKVPGRASVAKTVRDYFRDLRLHPTLAKCPYTLDEIIHESFSIRSYVHPKAVFYTLPRLARGGHQWMCESTPDLDRCKDVSRLTEIINWKSEPLSGSEEEVAHLLAKWNISTECLRIDIDALNRLQSQRREIPPIRVPSAFFLDLSQAGENLSAFSLDHVTYDDPSEYVAMKEAVIKDLISDEWIADHVERPEHFAPRLSISPKEFIGQVIDSYTDGGVDHLRPFDNLINLILEEVAHDLDIQCMDDFYDDMPLGARFEDIPHLSDKEISWLLGVSKTQIKDVEPLYNSTLVEGKDELHYDLDTWTQNIELQPSDVWFENSLSRCKLNHGKGMGYSFSLPRKDPEIMWRELLNGANGVAQNAHPAAFVAGVRRQTAKVVDGKFKPKQRVTFNGMFGEFLYGQRVVRGLIEAIKDSGFGTAYRGKQHIAGAINEKIDELFSGKHWALAGLDYESFDHSALVRWMFSKPEFFDVLLGPNGTEGLYKEWCLANYSNNSRVICGGGVWESSLRDYRFQLTSGSLLTFCGTIVNVVAMRMVVWLINRMDSLTENLDDQIATLASEIAQGQFRNAKYDARLVISEACGDDTLAGIASDRPITFDLVRHLCGTIGLTVHSDPMKNTWYDSESYDGKGMAVSYAACKYIYYPEKPYHKTLVYPIVRSLSNLFWPEDLSDNLNKLCNINTLEHVLDHVVHTPEFVKIEHSGDTHLINSYTNLTHTVGKDLFEIVLNSRYHPDAMSLVDLYWNIIPKALYTINNCDAGNFLYLAEMTEDCVTESIEIYTDLQTTGDYSGSLYTYPMFARLVVHALEHFGVQDASSENQIHFRDARKMLFGTQERASISDPGNPKQTFKKDDGVEDQLDDLNLGASLYLVEQAISNAANGR
jgi:hypothetical protein